MQLCNSCFSDFLVICACCYPSVHGTTLSSVQKINDIHEVALRCCILTNGWYMLVHGA